MKTYIFFPFLIKFKEVFYGYGHKKLNLKNKKDIVFRKSNFICNRTVLIKCSKAAKDLNRDLINEIKKPHSKLIITFKTEFKNEKKENSFY